MLFPDPVLFTVGILPVTLLDTLFTLAIFVAAFFAMVLAHSMHDVYAYVVFMLLPLGILWILPFSDPFWQGLLGLATVGIVFVYMILLLPWVELQQQSYKVNPTQWSCFQALVVGVPYALVLLRTIHMNPHWIVGLLLVIPALLLVMMVVMALLEVVRR
jgi:hypothetical protein